MTLLLFPSLRVVSTSMEFFRPPCHLLFLPVLGHATVAAACQRITMMLHLQTYTNEV